MHNRTTSQTVATSHSHTMENVILDLYIFRVKSGPVPHKIYLFNSSALLLILNLIRETCQNKGYKNICSNTVFQVAVSRLTSRPPGVFPEPPFPPKNQKQAYVTLLSDSWGEGGCKVSPGVCGVLCSRFRGRWKKDAFLGVSKRGNRSRVRSFSE